MLARYYLNLSNGEDIISDSDGIELADIHAALAYARKTVEELRAEDPFAAQEWQGWKLEIIDSSGQVVQFMPLDDPQWKLPSRH